MKLLLTLFLAIAYSAVATPTHYYDFARNLSDTVGTDHGSIAGAGPSYTSQPAQAVSDTWMATSFTDTDFVTLPTTVFDAQLATGTVKVTFFTPNSGFDGVVFGSRHGALGQFFIYPQSNGAIKVRMPTTLGSPADIDSNTGIIKLGRWYTVWINYHASGWTLWVRDLYTDTTTKYLDTTYASGTTAFNSPSLVYVGRYTEGTTFASEAYIDNLELFDTETTTDTRNVKLPIPFMTFGHSYALGAGSNAACATGNGYRMQWQNRAAADLKPYYFVGQTTQTGDSGTVITPYTDGVGGDTAALVLSAIDAKLRLNIITPTARTNVILAFIEYNDAAAPTNLDTYQTQLEAIANSINAWSSSAKIFFATGPQPTSAVNISAYVQRMRNAVASRKAAGLNIELIDYAAQAESLFWCADTIHPTAPSYVMAANFLYSRIFMALGRKAEPSNNQTKGRD